ncbi:PepSY-associated TM helix domain-containing protein [Micromonospora aurantiaca (nom. illeg.)]|uniref:PepSY-associated TM helix domain-containing protein n=1 Tax=Micromonospora aurantiaca (nom. illeg.) TaxID=47850 RepID=UPI0037BA08AD
MSVTDLSGDPTPDVPAAAQTARSSREPTPFAALLTRLHFYAGILVAPFLLVAALTGLAYTITPQLDQALYGDQLAVAAVGDQPTTLAQQVTAARAAHPDGTIATVAPGAGDRTTRVVFSLEKLGDKQHTVYVDPYTGEVTGQLTTWFGSTPATTWLDDLHRNLHLGEIGRHYSEIAASWLWVLVLGGVILWWRRRSATRARTTHLLIPDLSARKGVRRTRGWHATTGVWLAVGLLFLSATGLTWSRYAGANFGAGLDVLRAGTPELSTTLDGVPPPASGGGHQHGGAATGTADNPASFDIVLTSARGAGLSGPVEISPAAESGQAWTVAQVDNTWPVAKDRISVDPTTGGVTDRSDFADWPLLARLSSLGIQAHMGILFGPVKSDPARRARSRPALRHRLGLPHVVAAPPHPRRSPRTARRAARPRWGPRASVVGAAARRTGHRGTRLGTALARRHSARLPLHRHRPRHAHPSAPPADTRLTRPGR